MARFINKTLFSDSAVSYDNSRISDVVSTSDLSAYSVIASWTTAAATAAKTFAQADVNVTDNTITIATHGIPAGARGRLTTTGTLPAPLALLTDYFVIVVNANTIKLATSYDNAVAGTAVDLSDTGSGGATHTFTQIALGGSLQPQVTNDDPFESTAAWTDFGSAVTISGNSSTILYAPIGTSLPVKFPFNGVRFVVTNTGGGIAMNMKFHGKE